MVPTTSRDQSLSRFLPLEVLRQVADSNEDQLAPRKDSFVGTVLFADISGFTSLSERLGKRGPAGVEELTQTLNDYFGELIAIVISSGGDIVKFAGDALIAVWPAALEDRTRSAQAAAHCGLAAQSRLRGRKTKDGDKLSLRIGIGTGQITTASVGGKFGRWEFIVAGTPVLEATDAADAAERGDVVLGPNLVELLKESLHGRPLSSGQLRLEAISSDESFQPQEIPELDQAAEAKILGYIPAAIHKRLDVGHANWLGELRRLTVLFINLPDLNHQTPLPVAQQVMEALQTALYRYEGSVNKLSADDKGITFVAALGLPPLAHEDDELRGVLAAWDMKSSLTELGRGCSIGVTSGRVFCGIIGNSRRCEYTMIGDIVNLSARLMQAAQGDILCDQATFTGARRRLDFVTLPPISLKGKSAPVPVYRPYRKRRSAVSSRSLTPDDRTRNRTAPPRCAPATTPRRGERGHRHRGRRTGHRQVPPGRLAPRRGESPRDHLLHRHRLGHRTLHALFRLAGRVSRLVPHRRAEADSLRTIDLGNQLPALLESARHVRRDGTAC